MANEIAPGTWMQHVDDVMPKLKKANTKFMLSEKLIEVGNGYVITQSIETDQTTKIDVDKVVLALGSRPNNQIACDLIDAGYESFIIGDSCRVGKIADATKSAYMLAMNVK